MGFQHAATGLNHMTRQAMMSRLAALTSPIPRRYTELCTYFDK
jgi:hypothetical protein